MNFKQNLHNLLSDIDPDVLDFHEDEFWMIRTTYDYLEYYSHKNRYLNTALALPLARGLHNGTYRKLPVVRSGIAHKPPYVIHCLTVCKMLADFWIPITDEERDILLAAALCHDMIEDIDFAKGGKELYQDFHLDKRVYDIVKLVSKRSDFTLAEEQEYFHKIMENRFALLIKLSDRGHNVTDLYNMSEKKIEEYIGETRAFFLPMCEYAREHYPELSDVVEIQQDQLICLTKTVEMMSLKHERIQKKLKHDLNALRKENRALRAEFDKLKEEVM